ncbi:MAG: HAD family hydrolase [Desulfobacterales bacterium]|nr:HAD family hydrolase [Desulfobacterales bacterium]
MSIIVMKDGVPTIKSVIFDLDGTLIDSVPGYYHLMDSILEVVGLPPAPKSAVTKFMLQGRDAIVDMIPAEMHDRKKELIEKCITEGRKMLQNMFRNQVDLIPGVGRLFKLMIRLKIPIGVVSSTHRFNIDLKLIPLARRGLKEALAAVIAIEDAPKKKPFPDPLMVCASQLGVPPQRCLYVGDSRIDIQAGKAAGMLTIGVLTGLDDRDTLMRETPMMILDSVADLLPFFA